MIVIYAYLQHGRVTLRYFKKQDKEGSELDHEQ